MYSDSFETAHDVPAIEPVDRSSVLIAADYLGACAGTQPPPCLQANGILDKAHGPISKAHVTTTGVVAHRGRPAGGTDERKPGGAEILRGVLARNAVRSQNVIVFVDGEMPGISGRPVGAVSIGSDRLSGAGNAHAPL